ncbi:hypothetical protein C5Z25_08475 [Lactobacillus sp. CBA3605]|uniref:helix-turn-helix domain-containing protein n=1 Tax=Lactobacillus sp. CBA3605 TaxID=2099788 RepID=UPI000CFDDE5F|nr:helix-turn-helix transcriptional regulator [Lactobacillus sp. CBA3605]AVK61811.1 hypothetical protein C5Z25_08475 [Lactobacillus sp. CBA3605]
MKTLGLTVKQIRLDKGFSQKEIYTGIVSRSFATRFEHGQHDIAATKLFAILDNLGVSVDEYRFIAQHYQSSPLDRALLITTQAYRDQNFTFLTDWVRDHQHSPKTYERLIASYTSIRLIAFDHRQMPLTAAVQPAYQHLRQTKTWTVQELKLVSLLPALVASDAGIAALADFTLKMEQNCSR